jgi:predicted lipoprotein with Yx(FWY)xxD motif
MSLARIAAAIGFSAATLISTAFASPASIQTTANPQAGTILVDDHGMTLYRYTPDQPNSSTCNNGCAIAWPPVLVDNIPSVSDPTLASGLGVAQRSDGSQQLTYQSMPLYYYVGDRQPGDATGQGSDGVWFVVNP